MRRTRTGELRLTASDVMQFQGCQHAVALERRLLDGEGLSPRADTDQDDLLRKKGHEHERAWLEELGATGRAVRTAPFDKRGIEVAAERTRDFLLEGHEVVYQASLSSPPWGGRVDFLERVEAPNPPTTLGAFGYEPMDTKLKRRPHPSHVVQLALYADMLAELQGRPPEDVHIVLGDHSRTTLRLKEYSAYARRARGRLQAFSDAPVPTGPTPVEACDGCRWSDACDREWDEADSLWRVANIRSSQVAKLEASGVTTLAGLAEREASVPRLASETLEKLRRQARLQRVRDQGGAPTFELLEAAPGTGFAQMPEPAEGDLFFDMEGNPMVEGGLEYLFGIYHEKGADRDQGMFREWWAHDRTAEGQVAAEVLGFLEDHFATHHDAHVYHYNHYEVTALKRLASSHGVGEAALDRLLRGQRFVDLYRVVAQGMACSERGYSIKDMEAFYRPEREEQVATAVDSIVQYERWCETGEQAILDAIRDYNEVDCRSTKQLRDWLVSEVRPTGTPWRARPVGAEDQSSASDAQDDHEAVTTWLTPYREELGDELTDLLGHLATYHRREAKPAWWRYFDLQGQDDAALTDDYDCLGGLVARGASEPVKRSQQRVYAFPEQETKLRAGSRACFGPEGTSVEVVSIDRKARRATVKFGPSAGDPPEALSLYPTGPLATDIQRAALRRVIEGAVEKDVCRSALRSFLEGEQPKLTGREPEAPIVSPDQDLVAGVSAAVRDMDGTVLPIQGPPGTGKTYAASIAILGLLRDGKRVAVSSNGHEAIDNLFDAVFARADQQGVMIEGVRKPSSGCTRPRPSGVHVATGNNDRMLRSSLLVGGTAWLLCREEHDQAFDYLFIDEAGQVSLADTVAMSACARNVVLVGDPMQLPQVSQASHPGRSGESALEYALRGRRTIPPEEGVFLPMTRRLHPGICGWVSEIVYEGRLTSFSGCERQSIRCGEAEEKAGIRFEPVEHQGCAQVSKDEVERVAQLHDGFLGTSYTDRDGQQRPVGLGDVLVVAPYNAQVNALAEALPHGARVGTVDKFQGQEAPICIVSMTTSSAADMPRDLGFLMSLNRLNVAVSRAQALAVVVASPALMDAPVKTIEEMRLVSAFCSLALSS